MRIPAVGRQSSIGHARHLMLLLRGIAAQAGLAYVGPGLWCTNATDATGPEVVAQVEHLLYGLRRLHFNGQVEVHCTRYQEPLRWWIGGRFNRVEFTMSIRAVFSSTNHAVVTVE